MATAVKRGSPHPQPTPTPRGSAAPEGPYSWAPRSARRWWRHGAGERAVCKDGDSASGSSKRTRGLLETFGSHSPLRSPKELGPVSWKAMDGLRRLPVKRPGCSSQEVSEQSSVIGMSSPESWYRLPFHGRVTSKTLKYTQVGTSCYSFLCNQGNKCLARPCF